MYRCYICIYLYTYIYVLANHRIARANNDLHHVYPTPAANLAPCTTANMPCAEVYMYIYMLIYAGNWVYMSMSNYHAYINVLIYI